MTAEPERIQGLFQWSNESRFPGLTKPDQRVPVLFLGVRTEPGDRWTEEVFLVNNSPYTLKSVQTGQGGFETLDDEAGEFYMQQPIGRYYEQVLPGEAVKVTSYHLMYDSDFHMHLSVSVKSGELGDYTFEVLEKGQFSVTPLLWEDGTSKYARPTPAQLAQMKKDSPT